jgi:hypothetical protein
MMLEPISWPAYLAGALSTSLAYYGWVGLRFYRTEIAGVFRKKHTAGTVLATAANISKEDVFGAIPPDPEQVLDGDELSFGPAEPDQETAEAETAFPLSRQVSEFSEMVGEVKTLIRVVGDSPESRENFEMLFGLIIQKYAGLSDTPFREKINAFLLAESGQHFPFALSSEDLNQLWNEHTNQ